MKRRKDVGGRSFIEQLESRQLFSLSFANGVDNDVVRDTSSGKTHLVYYDSVAHNLKYAFWTTGAATTMTIDSSPNVGQFCSIALDHNHLPVVAYYDSQNADLKFARYNGTTWSKITVDSHNTVGSYTSIVYDVPNQNAYISYYSTTPGDLKVAQISDLTVNSIVTVDGAAHDVGRYSDIAITATGSQVISYEDTTNGHLRVASSTGGVLEADTSTTGGAAYTSIATSYDVLLGLRYYFVSYYDSANGDLKYVTGSEGAAYSFGTPVAVATNNTVGLYTNLFMVNTGGTGLNPNIVYYNKTGDTLVRAWNDGSWHFQTLLTAGGRNARAHYDPTDGRLTFTDNRTGSTDLFADAVVI